MRLRGRSTATTSAERAPIVDVAPGWLRDDFQSPQLRGSAPLGVMSRAEEQALLRAEMLTVRRRVA